jgi:hypothetical protein
LQALGRWHEALIAALAVLAETDESTERVNEPDGFWLGAVTEALNNQERRTARSRTCARGSPVDYRKSAFPIANNGVLVPISSETDDTIY